MKRRIKKVAVIGSGIMGSGIACHFANIGAEVLLLDIVPNQLTEAEEKKGLTLESKAIRNRIVNDNLAAALKSNPSLFTIKNLPIVFLQETPPTIYLKSKTLIGLLKLLWNAWILKKLFTSKLKNTVNQER